MAVDIEDGADHAGLGHGVEYGEEWVDNAEGVPDAVEELIVGR